MRSTIRISLLSLALTGFLCTLGACTALTPLRNAETECGNHKGHTLYVGPRGGCYYYNSNGNKTYVDREECDC